MLKIYYITRNNSAHSAWFLRLVINRLKRFEITSNDFSLQSKTIFLNNRLFFVKMLVR